MIYLAGPYSHPDPFVREQRFQAACAATAQLFRSGCFVFSPIIHGHPLVGYGLPIEWPFWEPFAKQLIRWSTSVVVLMLDGWHSSVGVRAEIEIATDAAIPVHYMPQSRIPTNHKTNLDSVLPEACS